MTKQRQHSALTDATIRGAKPSSGTQLTDGRGLYLKLFFDRPAGHSWRFDFTSPVDGKRRTLTLGNYPTVTLAVARIKADEAREAVANGIDPTQAKQAVKADQAAVILAATLADERIARIVEISGCKASQVAPAGSLLGVAQDMHAGRLSGGKWKPLHAAQWIGMITRCTPAALAALPIGEIEPSQVFEQIISPLEAAGKDATAITVRRMLGELFDYAERMKISKGNPARAIRADAKKAEESENIGNNPGAQNPEQLRTVLAAIRNWPTLVTRTALQVAAALGQRPGDTCAMRWEDLDLDAGEWMIPVQRRTKLAKSLPKKSQFHYVPLPSQVVALLRELAPITGRSGWVFESPMKRGHAITNDTLTNALRNMGLGGIQSAHGFRATMRTIGPKACGAVMQAQFIEGLLAHKIGMQTSEGRMVRDALGTSYNRERWEDERAGMVQAWADYLDSLLTVAEVVALPAPMPELLAA